jgi:hypothetical protein
MQVRQGTKPRLNQNKQIHLNPNPNPNQTNSRQKKFEQMSEDLKGGEEWME